LTGHARSAKLFGREKHMRIAIPKEIAANERRVALVPETVSKFAKSALEVAVQSGAGEGASFPDRTYTEAGA
jgi:NAD(P) transhydrogenase subunit alpha